MRWFGYLGVLIAATAAGLCVAAEESAPPIGIGQSRDWSWTEESRRELTVFQKGREVAVYHWGSALDKPYIHPLWTPDGKCVTYDSPADHVHHRGIFVGWPDVSGVDFWGENYAPQGKRGKMIARALNTVSTPGGGFRIKQRNDWTGEDGAVVVEESSVWTFHTARGNLQIVDVDVKFTSPTDDVIFGSTPEKPLLYHGLALRLGPFTEPRVYNSEGSEGDRACFGQEARWCALSGVQVAPYLTAGPVTVAMLDHPDNDVRSHFYVAGSSTQYISSSPLTTAPKRVSKGAVWRLRYRILAAGAPPEGLEKWDIEKLWKEYAKELPE